MITPETELVTYKQWDNYAMRIFNANMRRDHRSLSWGGIASRAQSFIIEIQIDRDVMIVRKGWRAAMRGDLINCEVCGSEIEQAWHVVYAGEQGEQRHDICRACGESGFQFWNGAPSIVQGTRADTSENRACYPLWGTRQRRQRKAN